MYGGLFQKEVPIHQRIANAKPGEVIALDPEKDYESFGLARPLSELRALDYVAYDLPRKEQAKYADVITKRYVADKPWLEDQLRDAEQLDRISWQTTSWGNVAYLAEYCPHERLKARFASFHDRMREVARAEMRRKPRWIPPPVWLWIRCHLWELAVYVFILVFMVGGRILGLVLV